MRSRIVFLAVAAACLGHAWAFDVQEESSLHVFQPPELAGDYVHSEALFGRPAYGGACGFWRRLALGLTFGSFCGRLVLAARPGRVQAPSPGPLCTARLA